MKDSIDGNDSKAELLFISPPTLVVRGIRKCWKSDEQSDSDFEKGILGEGDRKLITRIINHGHTSTLEHSLITFDVGLLTRAILQEVARHRIGVGISVESTRYTLKRLIKGANMREFLIPTGDSCIDELNIQHMENLVHYLQNEDVRNDVAKLGIVENYPVTMIWSFNFRSFRHFLKLRTSKAAHFMIRQLAHDLYNLVPEEYGVFFDEVVTPE